MTQPGGGAADDPVLYRHRGGIGVVELNRPRQANAISAAMREHLHRLKGVIARDPAVRVVIVTGAGRHFCGGADLKARPAERAAARRRYPGATDFSRLPQPVIAVINGAAMGGGCELALTCDFRFMAADARIGLTEIRFGELPLGGGTARLPRLVGVAAAKTVIMTGEPVTASQAARIGLVDFVEPPGELMPAAEAFAERLAEHPVTALRAAKALLNSALETDLAASLARESTAWHGLAASDQAAAAHSDAAQPITGPARSGV